MNGVACPDIGSLQALLQMTGGSPEPDDVVRHLETCEDCQRTLEGLAAEPLVWHDTAEGLMASARGELALRQVVQQLQSEEPAPAGDDLPFLRPADKPGLLGMLGDYEVQEEIGRGGMGVVLKAFDPALNRIVAIKVLSPYLAGSSTARRRFVREGRSAAAVVHDHIVAVHSVSEVDGLPYLVMQYVPGESLQARLDRTGPLELVEIVQIGLQTASGLAAAHTQGLVHRDIKPANLLLEHGQERVRITDFGLARMADDSGLTQQGVVPGTPDYMAPEQARGEPLDGRADLFSLGSVLYAMCTGEPPFRGSTAVGVLRQVSEEEPASIRALNPEIPEWLETLVKRLLAKAPADRFQSAAEVAALLEGHLARLSQPVSAPAPNLLDDQAASPVPEQTKTPPRRIRRAVLLGAGLLFVAAVASAAFFMAQEDQPRATEIEIYQDFRAGAPVSPFLFLIGQDADSTIRKEPAGLRITLGGHRKRSGWEGVGVRSTKPLTGDFEVTGTFELLSSGGAKESDAGVALVVAVKEFNNSKGFESRPSDRFAIVGRFFDSQAGNVYKAEHWTKEAFPNNVIRRVSVAPTSALGQLRLMRTGSSVHFQVSDGPGKEFREICQGEFGGDDMEVVQFCVNNRGTPVSFDARLLDFKIRTNIGNPAPAKPTDPQKDGGLVRNDDGVDTPPPGPNAKAQHGVLTVPTDDGDTLPVTEPAGSLNWPFLALALGVVVAGCVAAALLRAKHFPRRAWLPVFVLPSLLGVGLALWLGWSVGGTEVGDDVFQDFRNSRMPLAPLHLDGPDVLTTTKAEEAGLRITLPADRNQPPWAPVGVVPSFRLGGDFDVTGTYELLSSDRPHNGRGVGVVMWLASGWVNNTKFAEIAHFLRSGAHGGDTYAATWWVGKENGPNSGVELLPSTARAGQLRLIREGSIVRFLTADQGANQFREVARADFGTDDLVMRFAVNNGASPTQVDARLVNLRIHADTMTPTDPPPEAGQAALAAQGHAWKAWVAFGLVLALSLGLFLDVRRSCRAGKTAAITLTNRQLQRVSVVPIAFACAGCGKKLKAKPALAGKRIKCPNCAKTMVVPETVDNSAHAAQS